MTTTRRYLFRYPHRVREWSHTVALERLQEACQLHHWYRDPEIEGEPYGFLGFSFTVTGRDQWWCHRRAMDLAEKVCWNVLPVASIPEPTWENLPPHTNRGRNRVPASG